MTLLFGVSSVAFAALFGLFGARLLGVLGELLGLLQGIQESVQRTREEGAGDQEARFRDLEDLVDRLPQRWEEIKREASRLDGRARYAVSRAREELEERGLSDERLEDLGRELQLVDGGGSEDGGMQPMRESLAAAPQADFFQPQEDDWNAAARRVKFGG